MKDYQKELEVHLEEWKASLPEEEQKKFCYDGLMERYNCKRDLNTDWNESKRRIAFLLKDHPDTSSRDGYSYGADMRTCIQEGWREDRFWTRLKTILYGLTHMKYSHNSHDTLNEPFSFKDFTSIPFAYIEMKKESGTSKCSNRDLIKHMVKDKEQILKEFNILQPNIFVCCDARETILKFIQTNYLAKEDFVTYFGELSDGRRIGKILYYPERRIIIISSYHFSAYGKIKNYMVLERVFSPFRALLYDNPNLFE